MKAALKGRRKLTVIEGGKAKATATPKRTRKAKPKASAEAPDEDGFDPSAVPGAMAGRSADSDESEAGDDDDDIVDAGLADEYEGKGNGFDVEATDAIRYCADLDQNDRDNGRRLIVWFGANLSYVTGLGWLTWRGDHWERDEGDLHSRAMAQDIVDKIKLEPFFILPTPPQERLFAAADRAKEVPSTDRTPAQVETIATAAEVRKALSTRRSKRKSFAVTSGNAGRTSNMLVQATSLKAVDARLLDADHMKFNLRSGTLLFTRSPDPEQDTDAADVKPRYIGQVEHRPHDRVAMITKIAEVDHDPEAGCPLFKAFLDRMMPDPKMQVFLQVFHAKAMMIGGNGTQKVVYHYGLGGNGKSIFIETLGRLAGTYRTTVSPDTITGDSQRQGQQASPDIARLFNTRFVTIEELPKGVPLREELIKAVSGGGKMTARYLQKDIFEFTPIFTPVLSGNTKPSISGSDGGIWRRVLLCHWQVKIEEKDPTRVEFDKLLEMFDAERAGILNWLIEGVLLYLKDGLMAHVPPEVTAFTNDYRRERDNISVFAETMIQPAKGETVQAGVLFKSYTDWCEANSLMAAKQRTFGDRLAELGYEKTIGRTYVYQNVRLEPNPKYDPTSPPPPADPIDPGWSPPR